MTRNHTSHWFGIALLSVLLCGIPVTAWSQEQQGFAKIGGYAGVSFEPTFTLDGKTFNGLTAYREVDGDEIGLLPKLDEQKMFRGVLGYRYDKAALEFSYERTQHGGFFADVPTGDATFQQLNLDMRFFFLTRGRLQPYVLAGGGLPWLTIKESSFLLDEPEKGVGDGRWKGYALNTEVGVTLYPHPQVGVVLGYEYRPIWFARGSGITKTTYDLRPRFRESTRGFVFTTLFTF